MMTAIVKPTECPIQPVSVGLEALWTDWEGEKEREPLCGSLEQVRDRKQSQKPDGRLIGTEHWWREID